MAAAAALGACGSGGGDTCGPSEAVVVSVVDGDTVDLDSGERIRYLLVDAPELSSDDCWAVEARDRNVDLVDGKRVTLRYDVECTDRFDRLLAYVSVDGREVNATMVERGYACTLYIPPNGEDRRDEFEDLEAAARAAGRGLWGACAGNVTCD